MGDGANAPSGFNHWWRHIGHAYHPNKFLPVSLHCILQVCEYLHFSLMCLISALCPMRDTKRSSCCSCHEQLPILSAHRYVPYQIPKMGEADLRSVAEYESDSSPVTKLTLDHLQAAGHVTIPGSKAADWLAKDPADMCLNLPPRAKTIGP